MKYTHWGGKEENPLVSRLGFGTTRFIQGDLNDKEGLNRCVELVEYAIDKGINYFDVAPTYSNGYAETILGHAFRNSKSRSSKGGGLYVAAKTGLAIDSTKEQVIRRIDNTLSTLNKDKIEFYHLWNIMNRLQFNDACKHGGILDGILEAKERGLVEHICISLHAEPDVVIEIINENIFEGITISLNAMNYEKWLGVLKLADKKNIAVVTMNSLGGGMIPRYGSLFSNIDSTKDSIPIKALRFILRLPNVTVAMSGMPTREIIDENCQAVDFDDTPLCCFTLPVSENLCTGCNYCTPCSVGIPISACMQAYNHKILTEASNISVRQKDLINELFKRARANGTFFPGQKNCIQCKSCEKRCTQGINIASRMKWLEDISSQYGYDKKTMLMRLNEMEQKCQNSTKIAIWPAADYAGKTFDFWGNKAFEQKCVFVNASPAMWGKTFRGKKILSPSEIEAEGVDTIVIMHHRLQESIRNDVEKCFKRIKIVCLHTPEDIDWFDEKFF